MRVNIKLYLYFFILAFLSPSLLAAAQSTNTLAAQQYEQAQQYDKGIGVRQDLAQAHRLYLLAAQQGHVSAQYHLGQMYYRGYGVADSLPRAVYWFTRASAQGSQKAQFELATIFEYADSDISDKLLMAQSKAWYEATQSKYKIESELGLARILQKEFDLQRAAQQAELQNLAKKMQSAADIRAVSPSLLDRLHVRQFLHVHGIKLIYAVWVLLFVVVALLIYRLNLASMLIGFLKQRQKIATLIKDKSKQIKRLQSHIQKLQLENLQYKTKLASQSAAAVAPKVAAADLKAEALLVFGYQSVSDIVSKKQLTTRFKKLSHIYHPDTGGSQQSMQKLNQLFDFLKMQL